MSRPLPRRIGLTATACEPLLKGHLKPKDTPVADVKPMASDTDVDASPKSTSDQGEQRNARTKASNSPPRNSRRKCSPKTSAQDNGSSEGSSGIGTAGRGTASPPTPEAPSRSLRNPPVEKTRRRAPSTRKTPGTKPDKLPDAERVPKRSHDEMEGKSASHMKDRYGFTRSLKTSRTTYGQGQQRSSQLSALGSPKAKSFKKTKDVLVSSPQKSGFRAPPDLSPGTSPLSKNKLGKSPTGLRGRKKDLASKQNAAYEAEDEASQKPGFRNYLDDIDFGDDTTETSSSQAPNLTVEQENHVSGSDLALDDDPASDFESEDTPRSAARCPMCHAPVDPELLRECSKVGRMSIRQQTKFCDDHKRKAAREKAGRYPEIDWAGLELRFEQHQPLLRDILQGSRPSYYASLMSDKVDAGKNRTLLRSDDKLTSGYYGPRGRRMMTDFILERFSDTVRKRAVEERLVSARGHTAYVQTVLVPELAVRLIMQDMGVGEEEARVILQESSDVGELYQEALDIVERESDEE